MKLTDNEIRDIIHLLEQGRPLPDSYRFMLFEDKREVELVWNGKTHEVSNVVLPFQTIEQVDEPFTIMDHTENILSLINTSANDYPVCVVGLTKEYIVE